MFTLHTIIDGVGSYQFLGNHFQVIERETNYDEFCKAFESVFQSNHVADNDTEATNYTKNCFAFIFYGDGASRPLYKNQSYYIMTDNGKTFKNLTYK